MSIPAFYISPSAWSHVLILDREQTQHLRAIRLKVGAKAIVLDGEGKTAECIVSSIQKKSAVLEIVQETIAQPPKARAIMALALSKAVRRGFFMEKASELGAWAIWLWQAERSQGKLKQTTADACNAQLIAGLKQSQNPWLPRLAMFDSIHAVCEEAKRVNWRVLPWESQQNAPMLEPDKLGRPGQTLYVIGPEGGFADSELEQLNASDFTSVSLGHRVLRCETAATLCLGLHWWASQLPGHCDFHG